jgi:hypothetical protein
LQLRRGGPAAATIGVSRRVILAAIDVVRGIGCPARVVPNRDQKERA